MESLELRQSLVIVELFDRCEFDLFFRESKKRRRLYPEMSR